jgi:hypothetical protein
MANFLAHVNHIGSGNIRFNLQDLQSINRYTMAELSYITENKPLRDITRFYDGDENELGGKALQLKLDEVGIDTYWMKLTENDENESEE